VKKAPKRRKESQGKNKSSSIKAFRPLKDLKLGSKVSGKVIDVTDWGAFVNIGYATRGSRSGTALLHISQIQDKKIDNIRDIIKIGDSIEGARVINIDLKKGEVGLSLRTRRPKRRDFTKFQVGEKIDGKVDSVVPYGVFVDVGASVNALLHISRITGGAIENVRHHINEGDPVSVHVIDVDREKKTMAVSMLDKKADEYLDRRMSQRLKRFYGTAADADGAQKSSSSSDLDYFDQAIRELEEALSGREE
jgi:small subunit ribosomal protein S1